jgi:uncharacterized protein YndB with AHSA1/START domain
MLDAIKEASQPGGVPHLLSFLDSLNAASRAWTDGAYTLRLQDPEWIRLLFESYNADSLIELGRGIQFPIQDYLALVPVFQAGAPSGPPSTWIRWTRTGREPLFACLIRFLLGKDISSDLYFRNPVSGHAYLPGETLTRVKDWFDAIHPDLTSMDFPAAVDAAEAWHDAMKGRHGHDVKYRGPVPDALVVLRWPSGWTWQRLLDKRDFAREGIAMGHCIGGDQEEGPPDGNSDYFKLHRKGQAAFFSLRDPRGVPWVTTEVTLVPKVDGTQWAFVGQVMGPDDGPVPGTEDADTEGPQIDKARDYTVAALVAMKLMTSGLSRRPGVLGELTHEADGLLGINRDGFDPNQLPFMKRVREMPAFDDTGRSVDADRMKGGAPWRHTGENLNDALYAITHIRGLAENLGEVSVQDASEPMEVDGAEIPWFWVDVTWNKGRLDRGYIGVENRSGGGLRWFARRLDQRETQEVLTLADAVLVLAPEGPEVRCKAPAWFPGQTKLAASWPKKGGYAAIALAPFPILKTAIGSGK